VASCRGVKCGEHGGNTTLTPADKRSLEPTQTHSLMSLYNNEFISAIKTETITIRKKLNVQM